MSQPPADWGNRQKGQKMAQPTNSEAPSTQRGNTKRRDLDRHAERLLKRLLAADAQRREATSDLPLIHREFAGRIVR